MPIRFTSPSLGGQRQVFLQGGEWEAGVAYRRLTAGDWFVGDKIVPSAGPFGEPVHFNINTFDLSLAYGYRAVSACGSRCRSPPDQLPPV